MKNRFFRRFSLVSALVLCVLSNSLVQAAGLKTLTERVPETIARLNLQPVGKLVGTTHLPLTIGLPLHNQEALTNLLQQLYDPASPNYHHFLTPQQFSEMFGPSEQDYQAVIAFANTNGLTVTGTHDSRRVLEVNGDVAHIEKAFHVTMRLYQHPTENRTFFSADVAPSVQADLPIFSVGGLNNYVVPHPMNLKITSLSATNATPGAGSGPGGTYMGSDFRKAYAPGVSVNGSGQTVGLLQFNSGFYQSDITAYETQAGLPTSIPVVPVLLNGYNGGAGVANDEVSLDIEMVISMAPGTAGVYVFEGGQTDTILDAMASSNQIKQLSASWTYPIDATSETYYQQFAAQGQSFYNASGDDDAYLDGQEFPPTGDPNITIVGGTTLTTGSGGSYASETVWNWRIPNANGGDWGSSGGISANPIPSWQQGTDMSANGGSTTFRNLPDVALTADNIYVIYGGGQAGGFGGTSCASPLWAGFTALVNQQAVGVGHPTLGFINPAIYTLGNGANYTSDFHDITTGDNTWPGSPAQFFAVPGYDLCTGWGTPNGPNLINDLIGKRTGILQLSVIPPTGSALLQATAQPISVTVLDGYGVTNATVTATVTNSLGTSIANLTFTYNSTQTVYVASLSVPAAANPLTMRVTATAPGEIGITNLVVNYSVIGPPPNDNFTNATLVPAGGGAYVENNRFATLEANEPKHDGDKNDAASLWWSWMPLANTNVLINTIGSKVDNVLAVYTGGTLASLQSVTATSSSLTLYKPAQLSFNAQAYTTYYIAVASASSNALGTVTLNVAPGGQPDTNPPTVFIAAPQSGVTVSSPTLSVSGTASDPGPNASGISQVFVAVNSALFTAAGTTTWSALVPLQPGLNVIKASAVDQAGNISPTTTIEVNYLVQGPPNDFFVNAIALTGTSGTVFGTNTYATKEVGEPNPAGNPGGKSLWWTFTAPSDGVLTLDTSNSTFNTIMGLYTGTNVANLTTIVDNAEAYSGAPGGFSYISQAVRAGQTYHVLVDGYNGASGTISLGYAFVPSTVYHLTVNTSAGGTVQLSTTNSLGGLVTLPSTSADFSSGTTVVLTALPDNNDQFDTWSGGENSVANPLAFAVNSDLTVMANFVPRQFTDGFESGNLSHLTWTTAGAAPWFVQTNVVDVGQWAARSGVITNSQSSSLVLTTNFVAGTGSFDFKVSSEPAFDILSFSVDGVVLAQWSGEIGWANYSFPLTVGTHTLEWTYAKDPTISMGLDAGFLDDVILPIALAPSIATPAQIQLQQQTDGGMFMNLTGQSGQQYVTQTSPDLVHWQNISTNIAYGGFIRIPLPANGTNPAQFYRAVAP